MAERRPAALIRPASLPVESRFDSSSVQPPGKYRVRRQPATRASPGAAERPCPPSPQTPPCKGWQSSCCKPPPPPGPSKSCRRGAKLPPPSPEETATSLTGYHKSTSWIINGSN